MNAVEILRTIGLPSLGKMNGCICCHCEINGVEIDVACRSSSGSTLPDRPSFYGAVVRVETRGDDADEYPLEDVAKEVVNQIKGDAGNFVVFVTRNGETQEL